MAKTTKRINGDYEIVPNAGSGAVIISGNLNVTGTQTTVNTTDTSVKDNIIVLNDGESGAGVTSGSSGIQIDRGTSDNASFKWNETDDAWDALVGSALTNISVGTPTANGHVTTKLYVDNLVGGGGAVVDKINEGDSKAEIIDAGADIKFIIELDAT